MGTQLVRTGTALCLFSMLFWGCTRVQTGPTPSGASLQDANIQRDASAAIQCPDPPQASVDTSTWPEIFVGTPAQNCSDVAPDAGSSARPFCSPHLAINRPARAPVIITLLDGEYRLRNFARPDGSHGALTLTRFHTSSDANHFLILRAAPGARPIINGGVRLAAAWTLYSETPRIFRAAAAELEADPRGLWQLIDDATRLYEKTRRFDHKMKWVNGIRSHADVTALDQDFSWTKADGSGAGCPDANSGCYVYVRLDTPSATPDTMAFEVSQYGGISMIATKHVVIRGLVIRFTQSSGIFAEDSHYALFEENDLGHNANSNDNAYSLFVVFTEGAIIRRNRAFDSAYWGGTPNSKGITTMTSGSVAPIWICENEIFDIPGQAGIGTKSGVSNLRVIGNYIHDSFSCIETSGSRTQEGGSYGPFHPGGGWIIQRNRLERCEYGISFIGESDLTAVQAPDIAVNNLFVDNHVGAVFKHQARGARLQNNIFLGGPRTASCESPSSCGTPLLFTNNSSETRDISYFLGERGIRTNNNLFFQNPLNTHRIEKNWSNSRALYSLPAFQSQFARYDAEARSLLADPMLDPHDRYRPLSGSPALGAGDPAFYGGGSVNMGLYP